MCPQIRIATATGRDGARLTMAIRGRGALPLKRKRPPARSRWPRYSAYMADQPAFAVLRRKSRFVLLPGADAHHSFEVEDEDLAVADLVGVGGLSDGVDDL